METETKTCSRCGQIDIVEKFIKNRNICKECSNASSRQKYQSLKQNVNIEKKCSICSQIKPVNEFIIKTSHCKDCNNQRRRLKYNKNEEHRQLLIKQATLYKQIKVLNKQQMLENEIGKDNKKCKYCNVIKEKTRFRHNRLKCKDCERDEPKEKLKRYVRARIYDALLKSNKKKDKHTIEYLGCSKEDYIQWISTYTCSFTLENYGKVWHIDHVIPISKFNLNDEEEQSLAFNWRNTMPLLAKENLVKNSKILRPQLEQHLKKLLDYHKEKDMLMPQNISNLFARYLDAGSPLELSLPPTNGNICGELG